MRTTRGRIWGNCGGKRDELYTTIMSFARPGRIEHGTGMSAQDYEKEKVFVGSFGFVTEWVGIKAGQVVCTERSPRGI